MYRFDSLVDLGELQNTFHILLYKLFFILAEGLIEVV